MEQILNEAIISKDEKRTILQFKLLFWSYFAVNGLTGAYAGLWVFAKFGTYPIWLISAGFLVSFILAAAYVIMFFTKRKNIQKYKKKYKCYLSVWTLVVIVFVAGCDLYFNTLYLSDIFGGTKEIVTNEYDVTNIYNYLQFIGEDGEKTSIRVTDEKKKELNGNEYISNSEQEYFSDNHLFLHKENIRIKYYPKSCLLVELDFVE